MWLYVVSILIIVFVLVASIIVISKGYGYKGNKDDIEIDYDEINRKIRHENDDDSSNK